MADVIANTAVDVAELWLSRCRDALAAAGSEPLQASHVAFGVVAWDCCDPGMLVAGAERVYRSAEFPDEGDSGDVCETFELVVDVIVLLLRCIPTVDNLGNPPATTDLSAAYSRIGRDAAILWNALTGELPEGWLRANVFQQFVGDEGGCIGVETRLTIGLPQEDWCP